MYQVSVFCTISEAVSSRGFDCSFPYVATLTKHQRHFCGPTSSNWGVTHIEILSKRVIAALSPVILAKHLPVLQKLIYYVIKFALDRRNPKLQNHQRGKRI